MCLINNELTKHNIWIMRETSGSVLGDTHEIHLSVYFSLKSSHLVNCSPDKRSMHAIKLL